MYNVHVGADQKLKQSQRNKKRVNERTDTYSIDGMVDGDGCSSSSREILEVRHGLSESKGTDQNSKEHLKNGEAKMHSSKKQDGDKWRGREGKWTLKKMGQREECEGEKGGKE